MIQLKRIGCRIWRIGFISGLAASPAQAAILTGYVTPIASDPAGSIREVHSADKDYRIDLNQLPAGTRNRLESLSGKRQTSTLDLPDSAIVSQSDVPMGIRPDCTELPIDYGQVTTLAKNPAIQDQNQFLASIPPGTLQTFTLLSKSKSAQAPGINKDTPGVIRMSADGKLILRYTCDRSSSVFNTVEVIRFNDTTKKFVFSEIDFGGRKANGGKAAVPVAKPANRVHEDGTKCMTCHNAKPSPPAPIDPRPNWENYDQWPGVFGNDEDRFRVNEPEGRQEYDNFNNFKKNKLENEKDPIR